MRTRAGTDVLIVETTLRTRHVQIIGRAVEPGQGSSDGRSTDTKHARDRRDALVLWCSESILTAAATRSGLMTDGRPPTQP